MTSTHIFTPVSAVAPPPAVSTGARVGAIILTLISSLVLVGIGGCFLIGVLSLIRPELFIGGPCNDAIVVKPVTLSAEEQVLMFVLYGLAFVSFVAALLLFILAVRGLWRIL